MEDDVLVETDVTLQKESKKEIALKNAKITRAKAYESLYEHLTATEKKSVGYNAMTGEEVFKEVPLWSVQEKAQEKIFKILGDIRVGGDGVSNTLNLSLTVEARREIRGRIAKMFGVVDV